jgi:hypothetical protein
VTRSAKPRVGAVVSVVLAAAVLAAVITLVATQLRGVESSPAGGQSGQIDQIDTPTTDEPSPPPPPPPGFDPADGDTIDGYEHPSDGEYVGPAT